MSLYDSTHDLLTLYTSNWSIIPSKYVYKSLRKSTTYNKSTLNTNAYDKQDKSTYYMFTEMQKKHNSFKTFFIKKISQE